MVEEEGKVKGVGDGVWGDLEMREMGDFVEGCGSLEEVGEKVRGEVEREVRGKGKN